MTRMCSRMSTARQKYVSRHLGAIALIFGTLDAWFASHQSSGFYDQRRANQMKIWDLFEGKHLFTGTDPREKEYMTRAHLAEMIALMGPPPPELLNAGKRTAEFFDQHGMYHFSPAKHHDN